MASFKRHSSDPKASSLADSTTVHRPASPEGKESKGGGKVGLRRPGNRGWVTLVVDLILLAVVIGLVIGGEGEILCGGSVLPVRQGDELFFPYEASEVSFRGTFTIILCNPGITGQYKG